MTMLILSLAVAVLLPFLIFIPMSLGRLTSPDFNIKAPRLMNLTGWRQRVSWAHTNSLEALCYFTPAVCLSILTQADEIWCNRLGGIFLVARLLHPVFYACNWGWARFAAWFVGAGASVGLVLLSLKAAM